MNSYVFISGAAGGLGKAFAVECASRGWKLFLTDLRAENLQLLADGLRRSYGVEVLYQPCNLADAGERKGFLELIRKQGLRFWMLINVAGLDYEGLFLDRSGSQICNIIRVNIESTLDITHAILNRMDPLKSLRIITVSSLAAFYPMPVKATYAASKRFLLDFFLALGEEIRPLGATVTVLCPAGMPTNPECLQAIEAQGWMGQITTQNTGKVAADTIEAALRGKTLVIPGWINRLLCFLGSLVPPRLLAALISRRWQKARSRRFGDAAALHAMEQPIP